MTTTRSLYLAFRTVDAPDVWTFAGRDESIVDRLDDAEPFETLEVAVDVLREIEIEVGDLVETLIDTHENVEQRLSSAREQARVDRLEAERARWVPPFASDRARRVYEEMNGDRCYIDWNREDRSFDGTSRFRLLESEEVVLYVESDDEYDWEVNDDRLARAEFVWTPGGPMILDSTVESALVRLGIW